MAEEERDCFQVAMNIAWAWCRAREEIDTLHHPSLSHGVTEGEKEQLRREMHLKENALKAIDELETRIRVESTSDRYSRCSEVVKGWLSERKKDDIQDARRGIIAGEYNAAYDSLGDLL